jgi:hypothetical protein
MVSMGLHQMFSQLYWISGIDKVIPRCCLQNAALNTGKDTIMRGNVSCICCTPNPKCCEWSFKLF